MLLRSTDLQCIRDKLADGVLARKMFALFSGLSYSHRLKSHWDAKVNSIEADRPRLFSDLPHIMSRIAQQYDGKDVTSWIFDQHLAGRTGLRAVSIGCGAANAELQMAGLGRTTRVFESIVGFDPSDGSLDIARRRTEEQGLGATLSFRKGSIEDTNFEAGSIDVVFAFSSLHHLKQLPQQIGIVRNWLRPGGIIIAHEYVGPRRQQYSKQRVDLLKSLFMSLAPAYRLDWRSGKVRSSVPIPGALLMWLYDPSEMVESDQIEPALRMHFEITQFKPELGTLLLCLLKEIAHNFDADDPRATAVLDGLCNIELSLIESGIMSCDFATVVGKKTAMSVYEA